MTEETLVILPYNQLGSQGNELYIALNCWKKFCTFKYHFIVIGEFDESLKNKFPWVEFIYKKKKDIILSQYTQHLDVQECMEIIMKMYEDKYEGFIWMSDDFYAIKQFDLNDIKTIYFLNTTFTGNIKAFAFIWDRDKAKTRELLNAEKLPHYNYTIHFPCWFEFKKLKEIWDKFNMRNESYVLEDIYFNYFKHDKPIHINNIRLIIYNKEIFDNEFNNAINNPNIKFIVNTISGWSKNLEEELYKFI